MGVSAHAGRRRLRNPGPYHSLVDAVAAQLRARRIGLPPSMLAVLPVVGFGEQAGDVITPTLELLTAALGSAMLVVLVNRPQRQPPDGTLDEVQRWRRAHPEAPVAVADVALAARPRLGELRQLGVDAAEVAWGRVDPEAALLFVDDDVVDMPTGTAAALNYRLRDAPLALGPVLFDHPALPMSLLPQLYVGDLLRALLTDLVLRRLERRPHEVALRTVESLVLSGNLAVRRDALARVDGLHDLNELTELTRDVLRAALADGGPLPSRSVAVFDAGEEPVRRLRRLAVRMHSRRALAAYQASGAPTVAQWRGQRLRSSTVDPVRTNVVGVPPSPLVSLSMQDQRSLFVGLDRHLAVVLNHLQPQPEEAHRALAALGLSQRDVSVTPGCAETGWRVRVRRADGLVELLVDLQASDLCSADERMLADEAMLADVRVRARP